MKKPVCLTLCVLILFGVFAVESASAADKCPDYSGENLDAQNYRVRCHTMNSYLMNEGDYLVRFQADCSDNGYGVAYFDGDFRLRKHLFVSKELPLFGSVIFDGENYYLLSGKENPKEDDCAEVFRITKYDKSWKKLSTASLYGANTYIPFDAGCARMVCEGDYILIRTCHTMYQSDDGYHHQANVAIQLNKKTMEITDSFSGVMNSSVGYVSHSFNQFVRVDNGSMVTVDHGDAYPRSVVLINYKNDISSGKFYNWKCEVNELFGFSGATGDNYTGASVGGFEISESAYLVAMSSVNQTEKNSQTANIFVLVKPKNGSDVKKMQVTDYSEGSGSVSTPQLVKLGKDRFLLLWSRGKKVYFCELDSLGNREEIKSFEGNLSDCQPVSVGGRVLWYTWKDGENTFFSIDSDSLSASKKTVKFGHTFEWTKATKTSSKVTAKCSKCGVTKTFRAPEDMTVYFKSRGQESYWSYVKNSYKTDEKIYLLTSFDGGDEKMQSYSVKIEKPDVLSFDSEKEALIPNSEGKTKVTISAEYRPSLKYTYDFVVEDSHKAVLSGKKAATYFSQGYTGDKVCKNCGEILKTGKLTKKLRLRTPKFSVKAGKRKIKVKYKKVKDATGFEVRCISGNYGVIRSFKTKKSVTKTISGLWSGSFKVKIRAFVKKKGQTAFGKWSREKKVTVRL